MLSKYLRLKPTDDETTGAMSPLRFHWLPKIGRLVSSPDYYQKQNPPLALERNCAGKLTGEWVREPATIPESLERHSLDRSD